VTEPRRGGSPLARLLETVRRRDLRSGRVPASGDLEELIDRPDVDTQVVGEVALSIMKGPGSGDMSALWGRPLFHKCLRRSIVRDGAVERLLVSTRPVLLDRVLQQSTLDEHDLEIVVSIACQCFNNEYVYPTAPEEAEGVARLSSRIRQSVRAGTPHEAELVAYAMYSPLSALDLSEAFVADARARSRPGTGEVLTRHIDEYREDEAIRLAIPSAQLRSDGVTESVRAQYEQSPYPRWFTLTIPDPRSIAELWPESMTPPGRYDADRRAKLLVAGCGTGRQPISIALTYPDAEVIATDISTASLAYAIRQAKRYGVSNIEFHHASLLDVDALGVEFDVAFAAGVLHHLARPVDGLAALANGVKPGGLLEIGIYSRRARAALRPFQELAATVKPDGAEALKRIRRDVLTRGAVPRSLDWHYTSGLRDLLAHAHEVQFTPAELRDLLDACGLVFAGFTNVAPDARDAYRRRHPEDPGMRDLTLVDAFEAEHPGMFRSLQIFRAQRPRPAQ
jgi:2-polyprenyl-3-methyl-5-hydroxy-6-metoxy-1,4-benzoquinol methylase